MRGAGIEKKKKKLINSVVQFAALFFYFFLGIYKSRIGIGTLSKTIRGRRALNCDHAAAAKNDDQKCFHRCFVIIFLIGDPMAKKKNNKIGKDSYSRQSGSTK